MDIQPKTFAGKAELYGHLCGVLPEVVCGDCTADLANAAALLNMFLGDINWAGFYLRKGDGLVLGPFQGRPAVARINIGEGVCGTAAAEKATQVVGNVHTCKNHIACDIRTSSEIVVPVMGGGKIFGVIDIDSPIPERFDGEDKAGLECFARELAECVNWE
jgi:GAF domain-containing protein